MKFGVPWSRKGIRPEARETAKEAARRSGMSLDDWLNQVILQQAAQAGVSPRTITTNTQARGEELASVHQRLDSLTQRIEQFTRSGAGPSAYAPPHLRNERQGELASRLDQRIEQFAGARQSAPPQPAMPASLDRALAEIAARQRMLYGEPARSAPAAAAPAPVAQPSSVSLRSPMPAQDLSGLENQLRKITDQIETLRRPGVEEAINALRAELADIAHALNDAMPKRAIDTIEREIAGLTQRIAEGRQAGVDGSALAGVEHGLSEVRDALRTLTPAEHLVGFGDAVAGLEQKIDLIVAQKDPATLAQLESAITTLRSMTNNVASNDAVSHLAGEVQALADKVDQINRSTGAGDALAGLEQRIDALAQALADRAQSGSAVPPKLEALVQSLSDKIEAIQQSRTDDGVAVNHLEDRIVNLVQKLDASDSRLTHLEAIERGLGDLLVHIEEMRSAKAQRPWPENPSAVQALQKDIARTQDALDAVHGTLGLVVDRLAIIEKDVRAERRAVLSAPREEVIELTQPVVGKLAVRAVSDAPPISPEPAPPKMPPAPQLNVAPPPPPPPPAPPRRMMPRPAINPDLPGDQPLEPGSGPPSMRGNPSERIAASEAALGGARPASPPPGGASSFIQAARRAAQAAIQQEPPPPRLLEPDEEEELEAPEPTSLRAKMMKRVKSLFIAASIVAVIVGSIQIAGNMLELGGPFRKHTQHVGTADNDITNSTSVASNNNSSDSNNNNINLDLLAPPTVPALPSPPTASQPLLALPLVTPPGPEVTGSLPPAANRKIKPSPAPAAPMGEHLPVAIGGATLRTAALGGDAAAAYEVATRFTDGRGVPANLEEAAYWYERAASKGLAPAQFRYASMLEKGQGVKKDLAQARRLYLAAAAQGNAKAMHNLAVLYAEGIDGRPDYVTAAKWFEKAAMHGVSDSQYNLGILYARGIGVTKNLAEAYKWFALAAARGDTESAKKRDELAPHLSAQELAAARRAVETFVPMPQPEIAVTVPAPAGGWDQDKTSATAAPVHAAPKAKPPSGPLSLGSFTVGSR